MIDEELKKELDRQQGIIIDDKSKYICVSACPGAGKTYTLVNKIVKELDELKEFQGIIACSFTKESSKEIIQRLNDNDKLDNSYIGTIDSFIMKLIIFPYLNRYLFSRNLITKRVEITKILIDNDKRLNNFVRYYDSNITLRKEANLYAKEWLNDLISGIYSISFPAYILATNIIKMDIFKDYFSLRYPTIYIDEAQDLNYFQHMMLNSLKENTNINIVLLGDPNQSIYQFRGAKPSLFRNLFNQGYNHREITVSVRCHPSILHYANKIFNNNLQKNFVDSHVQVIDDFNFDFLRSLNGNVFILVENNKTAINIYEDLKNDFDIYFSKGLDDIPDDYIKNKEVIDELIKYYVNYDNENDRYKYPIDELFLYLNNYIKNIKRKYFKLQNRTFVDFIMDISILIGIEISRETVEKIYQKLNDEKYKYYYYISDKMNKIMTIHSSKGLESNDVVIILETPYNINNEEFKNKLFVAITRAKKNVYIYMKESFSGKLYINDLLK